MQQLLVTLTEDLEQHRVKLISRYQSRKLHSLRVCIRRIRSILKYTEHPRARAFRKTWGGFAALTNDSRDWDVFFLVGRDVLTEEAFQEFKKQIRRHRNANVRKTKAMLRSEHWERHLEEWRRFIGRLPNQNAGAMISDEVVATTLARASQRLSLAFAVNDERHWHKLRIAVKDVRYVVVAREGETSPDRSLNWLIQDCKTLQTQLGKWHDAIIQLELLEHLDATGLQSRLRSVLKRRRGYYLRRSKLLLSSRDPFRIEQQRS
jgi:CHAD domain-containing protein